MFGTYFYNKIITKHVVAFGTLFNNISIKKQDKSENDLSIFKVPISYGPVQKFLARIEQDPNASRKIATTLPRMSFEMVSIDYDGTRKSSVIQKFKTASATDRTDIKNVFMPTPYNIQFELNIMSKLQDDVLQIVEQILPFFQPSFNLSINFIPQINEIKDVPIILNRINFRDNYEEDFRTRKIINYTLTFTLKTYLYSEIPSDQDGLIKKVQVDYATDALKSAKREIRYTSTPKALQDYNDDNQINSLDDPFIELGDDFGFNRDIQEFSDFKTYSPNQGVDLDV